MRLRRLWLKDFRCYEEVDLELSDGCTVVTGANGQGKTSLLEAIGWVATARSFRGVQDAALVRSGRDEAIVRAEIAHDARTVLVEAAIRAVGRNRVLVNKQALSKRSGLGEALRVTVFAPDDLELVKGGPSARRAYLDDLLETCTPAFAAARSDYERVLKQRNARLRLGVRGPEERTTLEVLDDKLVVSGAALIAHRLELLTALGPAVERAYAALAGTAPGFASLYRPGWSDEACDPHGLEEQLRGAIDRLRCRELDRGLTLVGPHRDDWMLLLHDLETRHHASQGEQRTLALALRLAAHRVVSDAVDAEPLLLLDDVFSELDPERCAALVECLPDTQTILTTANVIPPGVDVTRRLEVARGVVSSDG
jgi:DNA replication and repair protein RecF